MPCTVLTPNLKETLKSFPEETEESFKALVGVWRGEDKKRENIDPTVEELKEFRDTIRGTSLQTSIESVVPENTTAYNIKYTPKGKSRQEYTIKGSKIYNKQGKEVFKKTSVDRYKIFANLAIRQGRAVIVEHNGKKYVVNNRKQIISITTGKLMNWEENNGDRKAIIESAREEFNKKAASSTPVASFSTRGYRKGDPQHNPNIDFIFTENAQAAAASGRISNTTATDIYPDLQDTSVRLLVSDVNGTNQAGIRTDSNGNLSENSYGIVVKKYQQNKQGKYVHKEGQFLDTDEDFELFKRANEEMFNRLSQSSNRQKVFPSQIALGKAALPMRFAQWLQAEIKSRYNLDYTIEKNPKNNYSGYGLAQSTSSQIKGENISSKGSEFAKKLTNPGNNLEIEFRGKKFRNAEHAYQTWKSGEFDETAYNSTSFIPRGSKRANKAVNYGIMVEILTAKLQQHPELIQGIIDRGGLEYLKSSTHNVKNDLYWESSGQNKFLEALSDAFSKVTHKSKEQERSPEEILDEALEDLSELYDQTAEESEVSEEVDQDTFDTPEVNTNTLEQYRSVELEYDPIVRRNRTSFISRLFTHTLDKILENRPKEINLKMTRERLSDEEKAALRKELRALSSRKSAIDFYSPKGLFAKVKEHFQKYVDDSEENRINAFIDQLAKEDQEAINAGEIDESERLSDEEMYEIAKEEADYRYAEYQKVLKHFDALADEASLELRTTEALIISPKAFSSSDKINNTTDSAEGQNDIENDGSSVDNEERGKDGWMSYYRHLSSHDSLSQAVRSIIRKIPKIGHNGVYEEDDLGNPIYLDSNYVHAALMDKLKDMVTSEDMIPLLEDLAKTNRWVQEIIELLKDDDVLYSQFYQDFRKDWASYWIQKIKRNSNGGYTYETININTPEGINFLLDQWRDNYESGTILTENSIYDVKGDINRTNAKKNLENLNAFINRLNKIDLENKVEFVKQEDIFEEFTSFLKAVGINPNPVTLEAALEKSQYADPVQTILKQLYTIFSDAHQVKTVKLEDGTEQRRDLLNHFSGAYSTIAKMLSEVAEDAIESSVREGDKSYYGHITPSYLGKLIKQLKNVTGDKEKFDKFIEDEFGQYEWFKKGDTWLNGWLEELVTNPDMRDAFRHKILLNMDKKEYTKMDDLDYTMALLHEYWSEKGNMAWYHTPILSDSPSAEFVRFIKYKTDIEGTYQSKLIKKFINLVTQEYNRIQLVKERFVKYQNGDKSIVPIANFDMTVENGNINKGGAEFKFLPRLNDYVTEDGTKFIDKFEKVRHSPSELEALITKAINDIMEDEFEKTYKEWSEIGLFEESEEGKYKYLPLSVVSTGQKRYTQTTLKALEQVLDILKEAGESEESLEEIKTVGRNLKEGRALKDSYVNDLFTDIKDVLADLVAEGRITETAYNNISRNLTIKNNAKEALREYFWNSTYATSQIIQLTTTDLAYYKNMEDFQKRYKEVHAPSLRLNTAATFHGKKIGRQVERTIYLRDIDLPSNTINHIKEIFYQQVKEGNLTKPEADYLINQFSSINVADAQAYRSLGSYRAMMGMMGQWTDEMETAYEHLTNGEWSIEDFNIIWQTKKPFVYTQVKKDSGVPNRSLKVPTQHKNSEFLLLALYHTIAGPLAKSGKLRAINEFMEKYDIDVVQFESAVKVGNQGIIDINDSKIKAEQERLIKEGEAHTEYDAVMSILRNYTGISEGVWNDNVVHTISYEDYGIQTATPEHILDVEQTIGTQIRKLIIADIVDKVITVDGKPYSREKLIELYNKINTENIIQSFVEIDEMFSDPKEIERVIQEELRGSVKYNADLQLACTLDKNGHFNIPLFDPVQSQRVQTLLNSIIKSRITKQKIKGGSLIQVTSYGVSEDLHLVYEGTGENKRLVGMECYMPAYSRKFYEPLMDENGVLHIDDWVDSNGVTHKGLPEDLRRAIGYRVPTEAKYSMVPLIIKGFLPQQNGSAIMLPAEITKITGSDFDKLSMLK